MSVFAFLGWTWLGASLAEDRIPVKANVPATVIAGVQSTVIVAKNVPDARDSYKPLRKIALTFDAGASGAAGMQILKTLKARDLRCTFFLTGLFAKKNPDIVRAIVAEGHELGNHTMNHPDLRFSGNQRVVQELQNAENEIKRISGVSTHPYFRPPYGARNTRVIKIAASAGYDCVYWTSGGEDGGRYWHRLSGESIRRQVLRQTKPGGVILLHMGNQRTANILPKLLDDLASRGYTLVPVSELGSPLPH
ncbi:MAG: polysaccharide deacetylase family protein [Armatimonadota bacterium]